jgi:hypothetical protein
MLAAKFVNYPNRAETKSHKHLQKEVCRRQGNHQLASQLRNIQTNKHTTRLLVQKFKSWLQGSISSRLICGFSFLKKNSRVSPNMFLGPENIQLFDSADIIFVSLK